MEVQLVTSANDNNQTPPAVDVVEDDARNTLVSKCEHNLYVQI